VPGTRFCFIVVLDILEQAHANLLQVALVTGRRAFSRARANTGKRIAAKREIMAITTKSSMSVNAAFVPEPDGLLAGRRN
jgi:hypothetical protein